MRGFVSLTDFRLVAHAGEMVPNMVHGYAEDPRASARGVWAEAIRALPRARKRLDEQVIGFVFADLCSKESPHGRCVTMKQRLERALIPCCRTSNEARVGFAHWVARPYWMKNVHITYCRVTRNSSHPRYEAGRCCGRAAHLELALTRRMPHRTASRIPEADARPRLGRSQMNAPLRADAAQLDPPYHVASTDVPRDESRDDAGRGIRSQRAVSRRACYHNDPSIPR